MHKHRLRQLRNFLSDNNVDTFLISNPTSLRYLLGFTGSSGLGLIAKDAVFFITDFRYKEQASQEITADEIILAKGLLIDSLKTLPLFGRIRKLGFESGHVTFDTYQNLSKIAGSITLTPYADAIERIAAKKSSEEIALIKKACEITVTVFNDVCPLFHEGVSELEIAAEISYRIKKEGGEGDAFDPQILFGKNSALPHGMPGNTRLQPGDTIQIDFGARYNGYCADFSRVLVLGNPSDDLLKVHDVVKNAVEHTIETIKPGKPANEIDATARNSIIENGYAEYFGHAVGHGVGITVHALPKISPTNAEPIEVGNVFTIEPGIYISNCFGVRIEDLVCIGESGVTLLTEASRELTIL